LESSPEEVRQPVTEHLVELTRPVIRSLIAFGAGTAACSTSQGEIYKRLIRPVTDALPADSS
jgi:sec-independent protein translocase protein TatC